MVKKPGIENQHPNSLKNLAPPWDADRAKKAQAASVVARKANAEAREKLKMTTKQWESYKKDVLDSTEMSSVDLLKILMWKAVEDGEMETAADLAKSVAEFETPKLARVESVVEDARADEMSDEELEAKIKELMNDKKDSD